MEFIKNIRKNTYIILIVTILVLVLSLKEDFTSTIHALRHIDYTFIILAFFIFVFSLFLKAVVSYDTVNDRKKYSLKEAMKHILIVQFFNGITPFSTGGQPMEVYMLKEHGINASKGTNIIIQNFIFYQIALVLFGIFAVTYNAFFHLFPEISFLRNLVVLGFFINTFVAVLLLFIAFAKKTNRFFIEKMIQICYRIKLVKDKKKTQEKWERRILEFHESTKLLKSRKGLFIRGILANLISLACFYSIPLFIVYSMHDFTSLNFINTIVSSAYVLIIGSFVPIPGASGGIEYGFLCFFHSFLSSGVTSAVLLVWRFITYYLPMIVGAIVFNIDERSKNNENRDF